MMGNSARQALMKKSKLIDGFESWMGKKTDLTGPSSYHSFLAIKADVFEVVKKGYPLRTLWEYLYEKKIYPFSYESFCRNVRQEKKKISIKEQSVASTHVSKEPIPDPEIETTEEQKPHQPIIAQSDRKEFTFNPTPPDLDTLWGKED